MSKKPYFTVIVPIYNVEKYLSRCIDSILNQVFTNFELLLIDDGSKDKSGEICDIYAKKDNRVKVFHKENGGVSSARNVGINNSEGELITFVDSDDWIEPLFLNNFIKMNTGEDLLVQGFKATNWKNKDGISIISQPKLLAKGEDIFNYLLRTFESNQLGYIWCKAFKRDILFNNKIRFSEKFSLREDLAFVCLYCTYTKSIKNTSDAAYNYYYTPIGKKFKQQDSMAVCIDVFKNLAKVASDEDKLERLKKHYVSLAICSLIDSAENKNIYFYCRFFNKNFSKHIIFGDDKIRKIRLFKKLYNITNDTYLYFIVRLIYFLVFKK